MGASPAASRVTPRATPPDFSYGPVDHDQRNTLNTGFTASLPTHTWFATNVYNGSGFTNGLAGSGQGPYQGNNLPVHTTFDVSAGHSISDDLKISANVINVTNNRVLLDNSVTIGGFHYNDPRMFSAALVAVQVTRRSTCDRTPTSPC